MIIGSAGDTGANSRVDRYVAMIKELAAEHGLKKFKLGYFYSEVEREWLRAEMRAGNVVQGLDGFADLSEEELDATDRSEEHTSELQSLMRISYAVFCLTNKTYSHTTRPYPN